LTGCCRWNRPLPRIGCRKKARCRRPERWPANWCCDLSPHPSLPTALAGARLKRSPGFLEPRAPGSANESWLALDSSGKPQFHLAPDGTQQVQNTVPAGAGCIKKAHQTGCARIHTVTDSVPSGANLATRFLNLICPRARFAVLLLPPPCCRLSRGHFSSPGAEDAGASHAPGARVFSGQRSGLPARCASRSRSNCSSSRRLSW